ncbi:hypothetical protein [Yersinia intermedia]|uniref:Inosamine-phosphate amidinotransferase 1 n=1 Tax=Yersinia intermedia TaxID=631 RepID=A0A208ZVW7_YERIN|nr:hypothetical protein [Yersinia intermedia]OVZ84559.1 hypothetical protein CBW57_15665 [Yersinia intermedia]
MNIINSYSDWGKLEEIILGSPKNLTLPDLDISSRNFFDLQEDFNQQKNPVAVIERVKIEMEEDFQGLTSILEGYGVKVRRPEAINFKITCQSPHWSSQQSHALMPRDCMLVLGDTLIEAPMPSRNRYFESQSFRNITREYFSKGEKWIAAPKPVLTDDTYLWDGTTPYLAENDPLFDAANIMRCGKDVFYNISNSGNRAGFEWLERTFGDQFNFHQMSICSDHVGTTMQLLRPGLALINASRMKPSDVPAQFKNWELVFFNEPVDVGYSFDWARASVWIAMNVLSIDEKTIIVEKNQCKLAELLDRSGLEVIPVSFRHGRTVGGGFHCCSLDIRRVGVAESFL